MKKQKTQYVLGTVFLMAAGMANALVPLPQSQTLLSGATIPKFVDPLPVAGDITVVDVTSTGPQPRQKFTIAAHEIRAQILPTSMAGQCGPYKRDSTSSTYGYMTAGDDPTQVRTSYLGPVVVAERGVPAFPVYLNNLPENGVVQSNMPIDMTLDWANPLGIDCMPDINGDYSNPTCGIIPYWGPMPIAAHLHGGEVAPAYDGGPDAWFTPGEKMTGPGHPGPVYTYPNEQQESTIWFHDHALGITRLNVYAGLAGLWPIIDPANTRIHKIMPKFPEYDIPLIIQDRSFDTNCEIFYNVASNPQPNPTVHPFWTPEFIGDTIVVNGKTWPYLDVEPRQYRFRYVNGSNARFYELTYREVKVQKNGKERVLPTALPQLAIATDDGYLVNATATQMIVLAPGERYEVIFDFSAFAPGTIINLMNSARTPYPGGGKVVKDLTDTVMRFRVSQPLSAVADTTIADGTRIRQGRILPIVNKHNPWRGSITRQLTLNEVIGPGGPLELVINNSKFNMAGILSGTTTPLARETELPAIGDTEIWEIINISADAHPMHLHLTSFQVLDRTPFKANRWLTNYEALLAANGVLPGEGPPNQYNVMNLDGAIGGNPAISTFLKLNLRRGPEPYEIGLEGYGHRLSR